MLLLSLLSSSTLAHSPHDNASVLAVADGIVLTNDNDVLGISDDGGDTFRHRWWSGGAPECAAVLSAEQWLVSSAWAGVWWTEDDGANFTVLEDLGAVSACDQRDGVVVAAERDGAWEHRDGGWQVLGEDIAWQPVDVLAGPVVIVVSADGSGWRLEDETWLRLPLEGMQSIGAAEDTLLAGLIAGPIHTSTDGGVSWSALLDSPEDVVALTGDAGTWQAATVEQAAWVSTDEGQTWLLHADGLDAPATGGGGPRDGVHFAEVRATDDGWMLAGFEGVYWWTDGAWRQGALDGIPRVRSLAWGASDLLVASYGGGVYRGPADWQAISDGIDWSYPRYIIAPTDDHILLSSSSRLYTTTDGGQTWISTRAGLASMGDRVAVAPGYPDDPRIAASGIDDAGDIAVSLSEDGGLTWQAVALPGDCTAKPRALDWGEALWAGCGSDGALYRSEDGQVWEQVATIGSSIEQIRAQSTSPLLATRDGLYQWHMPDGVLESVALAGVAVSGVAAHPDGDLYIATLGAGLTILTTEGDLRFDVGPDTAVLESIDISADGQVAVGARDGAWILEDGAWSRMSYDRLDDQVQQWAFSGWQKEAAEEAISQSMQRGDAGAVARVGLEAAQVRLIGAITPDGALDISVDGGEPERVTSGGNLTMLWAADLEPGWHELVLEVTAGSVAIDAIERWRSDAPALPTVGAIPPVAAEGCGCQGGAPVGGLLLVLLAALPRRRVSPPD
ncbi:MAG: hypothetical protein ACI8RZ_002229 [Myxococcota bacterium]|jgi:hypothetical protein